MDSEDGRYRYDGYGQYIGKTQYMEGFWKRNLLHGKGRIVFDDGLMQEGQFQNDKLNGPGKVTYPDGQIEEG